MAITSIGSAQTSDFTQSAATAARQQKAAKLLAAMDTDKNGEVSKAEFKAFGEKLKASGAAQQPPSGGAQPSVNTLFSSADTDGSQSLSLNELTSKLAEGETRAKAAGAQGGSLSGGGGAMHGPGGAKPAGGGGGGAMTTSSTSSSSSTSSANTDPADANQDGTVSAAEELQYELTHPNAAETK
jgi:hypothetical protein